VLVPGLMFGWLVSCGSWSHPCLGGWRSDEGVGVVGVGVGARQCLGTLEGNGGIEGKCCHGAQWSQGFRLFLMWFFQLTKCYMSEAQV